MKSPLALLAACFALGLALYHTVHSGSLNHSAVIEPTAARIPYLLACAGACLLGGVILLRARCHRSSCLLLFAGFVAVGAAASPLFELRFPPNHVSHLEALGVDLGDPLRLEGRVVSTPRQTAYGLQFDVEASHVESRGEAHNVTGKVRLRVLASEDADVSPLPDGNALHLEVGDSIRAMVRLRRPHNYQNPGSFDFRHWMESFEDLFWVGTIKNPLLVEKLPDQPAGASLPNRIQGALHSLPARTRLRLIQGIDGIYPPWTPQERYGAVLKAVLWGDRTSLDSDTIESFRRTGLYHLLVIAGLHVGLLVLLGNFFLRLLPISGMARSVSLLASLGVYALLVEQRAPTLRATIMIAAYLSARLLDRDHSALNAVGFAALLLLLHRPAWLFEAGFQLSFSAALLIVCLAVPILERTTEPYRRALGNLEDERLDDRLAPKQAQLRLELRALIAGIDARVGVLARHPWATAATVKTPLRLVLWALSMVLFTTVLQLGLILPMVETFHRVTFMGVVLNALAIPVMALLLACALPTAILSAIAPGAAAWLGKPLGVVMASLFALTRLPLLPGWLSYRVPAPPAWVAWGFSLAVVAAGVALGSLRPSTLPSVRQNTGTSTSGQLPAARSMTDSWMRRTFWLAAATAGTLLVLISSHPFSPQLPAGALELTALDCGQGDALFVVFPDRRTMLIDGGGSRARGAREGGFQGRRWDPGEDIVSPYIWSRGIKKIDVLVLSQAHEDHLGGLPAVLENFRVGEFWHAANPATPAYLSLLEQVRQRGIPARQLARGDVLERGGATVQVLWPPAERQLSGRPSNDDSLALRVSHGGASLLLPGDISQTVEQELLASAPPLESQVLKVSHHGARSASGADFLARVSPRVAVVSAEYGGLGNLPNPETLARLRGVGAQVFRTDLDGAITVELRSSAPAVRCYGALAGVSTAGAAVVTGAAGEVTFNVR